MKVRELIPRWEETESKVFTTREYLVRLPVRDAARVSALAELYPQRSLEEILTDLLAAALDEVEEALPYHQGTRVIAEDDLGDPVFEDIGPSGRFRSLTAKYKRDLKVVNG